MYQVNPDIKKSETLDKRFYQDHKAWDLLKSYTFTQSWHLSVEKNSNTDANLIPFVLLSDFLDEPLLWALSHQNQWKCLSNVCTHRGNILVDQPKKSRLIQCGYHGRCFHLDGQLKSMPEFEAVEDFPRIEDHLHSFDYEKIGNFHFIQLIKDDTFFTLFGDFIKRMFWFPFDLLVLDLKQSVTYEVNAHWALYVENYLEGFHVPFVHPGLGEKLDYANYETELFTLSNLQLGVAETDSPCFDLPQDSTDYGKSIYAYYWWFYPNLMINIYTWGVSINIVEPIDSNKTRVKFYTYLLPQAHQDYDPNLIHQTEMEDEKIVQSVSKGIKSKFYPNGRYSVSREKGIHHFHMLLCNDLQKYSQ
jgi:choline monooxygenase